MSNCWQRPRLRTHLLDPDELLSQVTKTALERALGEELTEHLYYDKRHPGSRGPGNSRNGTTSTAAHGRIAATAAPAQPAPETRRAAPELACATSRFVHHQHLPSPDHF